MAVDEYEKSAEAKYKTYIRSGETHTWEQVIEEVDRAAAQYNDKSSLWHKIRQGLRKFGEGHSAFDAWLGLLPTQSNYCSMLCGGLKLILKVKFPHHCSYIALTHSRQPLVSKSFGRARLMPWPRFQSF